MKNLKRLGISITLLCLLTMTAFAGETNSPPCVPGETNSPPCSVTQNVTDDSAPQNQSVSTIEGDDYDYSITDMTVDLVQSVLSVF